MTENVGDFGRLFRILAASGERHAGVILVSGRRFPRSAARSGDLVDALALLLQAHLGDDALRDRLLWL